MVLWLHTNAGSQAGYCNKPLYFVDTDQNYARSGWPLEAARTILPHGGIQNLLRSGNLGSVV